MKLKLPSSAQNWTSLTGATIALIMLFMIGFFFVVTVIIGRGGVYMGLVMYILLPAVMVVGLLMVPVGMIFKARRERKQRRVTKGEWPSIDLNNPRYRNAFFIFAGGTTVLLLVSAVGSYEAFHFTESVAFCGRLCHQLMRPEYTAYQYSPHARVPCVACHVGPGAGWYVRSKLSGLYQVYATLTKTYPKPIPTPIKSLRPAREVCEQCHWPQKFYTYNMVYQTYYLSDETNSEWDLRMIVKTGAEHAAMGLKEGIHWHINPDVKIEYVAADRQRESLPRVRYTNLKTSESVVYEDKENPLKPEQAKKMEVRTMDCMDCHNRPSHDYRSPSDFMNEAMTASGIWRDLPMIKYEALEAMAKPFPSTPTALETLKKQINEYYEKNHPQVFQSEKGKIDKAVDEVQKEFSRNIFPEMKVQWNVHPNNIGHLESKGCFRCHNNTHTSKAGQSIRRECNLCHTIIGQGPPDKMQTGELKQPLEFEHPVDIGDAWKEGLCSECHTGLNI